MTSTAHSRPRRLARASAAILSLGLAAAIAGCSGNATASSPPATSAAAKPTASATPTPTAKHYGDVIGTGKQVKAADGSSYETIALPADSAIYSYTPSQDVLSAGYTAADALAGRKLVADFMTTQFMDSTALETKEAGLAAWTQTESPKWLIPEIQDNLKTKPLAIGQVILGYVGDANKVNQLPAFVHDGKPRVSEVSLQFTNVAPFDGNGYKGIEYDVNYLVSYRVPTSAAAAYAASLGNETVAQFLASGRAKPKVKGPGEVAFVATGTGRLLAQKQPTGGWLVAGIQSTTDYNLSDFVDNS